MGRTAKQVTGFKGRSGRNFRAKLKLEQDDEGKWRVDFDEDWATGARPQLPEGESEEEKAESETSADGAQADPAPAASGDGANGRARRTARTS